MKSKAEQRKQARLLFDRWCASLADRDRSKSSLANNFDDLFFEMDQNFIEFEIAHEFLEQAITVHLPSKSTVEYTYKRGGKKRWGTKEEFYDDWKRFIKDTATNVFYSRYPLPDEKKEEESVLPTGMSRKEYLLQRKHADSFPQLDLSQIPDLPDEDSEDVSFSIADLEGADGDNTR